MNSKWYLGLLALPFVLIALAAYLIHSPPPEASFEHEDEPALRAAAAPAMTQPTSPPPPTTTRPAPPPLPEAAPVHASVVVTAKPAALVTRAAGGPLRMNASDEVTVNEGSSLRRQWVTVHLPGLPADLRGTVGVETAYRGPARGYAFRADIPIVAAEPLAAVEVRFLAFDVWGEHMVTLVSTEISDIPAAEDAPGGAWTYAARWSVAERDCATLHSTVAYIARVRTRDGRVFEADPAPVIEEAQRLSRKFTPADLEPAPAEDEAPTDDRPRRGLPMAI
jgi:hypothetical protein